MRDHDNEDSEGGGDYEGDQEDESEWDENEWDNDEYEDMEDEDDEDDDEDDDGEDDEWGHHEANSLELTLLPYFPDEMDSDCDAPSDLNDDRDDPDFIASLDTSDVWDDNSMGTHDQNQNLTRSIVELKRRLRREHARAPWNSSPPSPFFRVGQGWPMQIPFSRSTSNHFQCANSLCLASSDHGIDHCLFTIFNKCIVKCGIRPDKQSTEVACKDTKNTSIILTPPSAFTTPLTWYTKHIVRGPPTTYLKLMFEPLCLAHQYGYLVVGGESGGFVVYCTMNPSQKPVKVWNIRMIIDNREVMTNSVQIVRWKIRSNLDDDEGNEYDNYNEHLNQFEYNVIVSVNEGGVLVYRLPCHQDCHQQPVSDDKSENSAYRWRRSITMQRSPIQDGPTLKPDTHLNIFDACPINDAKVSPDGKWMVCVGDSKVVFLMPVICRQAPISFGPIKKLKIPHSLLSSSGNSARYRNNTYTSQYVSWNSQSTLFAHTSDTHNVVLVWTVRPKHEVLHVISAAGLTYAISFHPVLPGVLAYAYRYGYIHTVNLGETVEIPAERAKSLTGTEMRNLMEFDQRTDPIEATENLMEEDLTPNADNSDDHLAHHTCDLSPRQEIMMLSFRTGAAPTKRVLDKINGLVWSPDGCRLYIATEKRVLCHEFTRSTREVPSLMRICSGMLKSIFENHERSQKWRELEGNEVSGPGDLPSTEILGQTQIAREKRYGDVDVVDRLGSLKRSRIGLANTEGSAEGETQLEVDSERWKKNWAFAPASVKHMVFGDDFGLGANTHQALTPPNSQPGSVT